MLRPLTVSTKQLPVNTLSLNGVDVDLPVVGGHAGITILPVFSQVLPAPLSGFEQKSYFITVV